MEATKDNLEVDENTQSPAVSPVSSFQSCSKTAGTAELEDELVSDIWFTFSPLHPVTLSTKHGLRWKPTHEIMRT